MTLYFENVLTREEAVVKVRMFRNLPVSEWEVVLLGIPKSDQGKEVTINFLSLDINNKDTFYTDSNGLEMQKRVLNYRPTWDWSGSQNITANYYPV